MNNLFSGSWRKHADTFIDVEMSPSFRSESVGGGHGANLHKFFEDVEGIKDELKEVEELHKSLHASNESLKTLHDAAAVHALRARMDNDVSMALKKAKSIKTKLELLDNSNEINRSIPGCGPGTSTDRTRTSVVAGLRKKLKQWMDAFALLRSRVTADYREVVERRYYTVTGEKADEATVEALVASGEGERILARAIKEQGRGQVIDVITEMQERHGAAAELERSLGELHQVFLDMSVLVAAQGQMVDDIENQVRQSKSFIERGNEQLVIARRHKKNSYLWTGFGVVLLLIIILVIVLPIVINKK